MNRHGAPVGQIYVSAARGRRADSPRWRVARGSSRAAPGDSPRLLTSGTPQKSRSASTKWPVVARDECGVLFIVAGLLPVKDPGSGC
jgi:hypothetical protein